MKSRAAALLLGATLAFAMIGGAVTGAGRDCPKGHHRLASGVCSCPKDEYWAGKCVVTWCGGPTLASGLDCKVFRCPKGLHVVGSRQGPYCIEPPRCPKGQHAVWGRSGCWPSWVHWNS